MQLHIRSAIHKWQIPLSSLTRKLELTSARRVIEGLSRDRSLRSHERLREIACLETLWRRQNTNSNVRSAAGGIRHRASRGHVGEAPVATQLRSQYLRSERDGKKQTAFAIDRENLQSPCQVGFCAVPAPRMGRSVVAKHYTRAKAFAEQPLSGIGRVATCFVPQGPVQS